MPVYFLCASIMFNLNYEFCIPEPNLEVCMKKIEDQNDPPNSSYYCKISYQNPKEKFQ